MKKVLLLLVVANCLFASAQTKKYKYKRKSTPKVAKADSTTILYNMGWDYYKMDSMGPARYYWELATYAPGTAASRNAAYHRLGLMQQNAEGCETNLPAAIDYYRKGAGDVGRWGNFDAIKAIAGCYENGFGVDQNLKESLKWYLNAKRAGSPFVADDIVRVRENIRKIEESKENE
jgi:TPR repeat protein